MIARLLFIEDIPPQQESTFFFFLGYLRHDRQVEVESEFLSDEKLQTNDLNIYGSLFF